MHFKTLLTSLGVVAAMLTAGCGGGGASSGGNSSGTVSNNVSISGSSFNAGTTFTANAHSLVLGSAVKSMAWSVTPLSVQGANAPALSISDPNCASASMSPNASANTSGEGSCSATVSIPAGAQSGSYRITNTMIAANGGSASGYSDFTVLGGSAASFSLIDQAVPVTGSVGTMLSMSAPFSVANGATVKDVSYTWTASAQNPTAVALAGSRSSTATFIPPGPGQYSFNVTAQATVNGVQQTATTTIVAVVFATSYPDVISAGATQIAQINAVVNLTGTILNQDSTLTYTHAWTQTGGPTVSLSNSTSPGASFVPTSSGTYTFQYQVTKYLKGGGTTVTTAQTQVIVQSSPAPVFTLSAGNAQTATIGTPVNLIGTQSVSNSSTTGITYAYSWAQISGPVVKLSNSSTSQASFIPTTAGNYVFELTLTATTPSGVQTVSAQTQVTVAGGSTGGFTMVASAGAAQSVTPNSIVTLQGTTIAQGTTQGVTYAYAWTQLTGADAGPATVSLSNANTTTATFQAVTAGTYGFKYTVTATLPDGTTQTSSATTQVIVTSSTSGSANFDMSINAGTIQAVQASQIVNLAGTVNSQGSSVGVTYKYAWTQVGTTPATVTLANANSLSASTVPTTAGTYTFQLTVTATLADGSTRTASAQTQVIVSPATVVTPATFAMSITAGNAQATAPGSVVSMTGAVTAQGTAAGVRYTYAWTQLSGTAGGPATVTLANPTTLSTSFYATTSGTYGFQLTVTATLADGTTQTATSQTQVVVTGSGGVAFSVSAGNAQTATVNTAATLTGVVTAQGSTTGVTYTYAWTQVGSVPTTTTLSNANSLVASIVPTTAGTYTFQLSVTATTPDGKSTTQVSNTQVLVK